MCGRLTGHLTCKPVRVISKAVSCYPKQTIQRTLIESKRGGVQLQILCGLQWHDIQVLLKPLEYNRLVEFWSSDMRLQLDIGNFSRKNFMSASSRRRNNSLFLQSRLSKQIYVVYKDTLHNLRKCFINLFISFCSWWCEVPMYCEPGKEFNVVCTVHYLTICI